jgi:hypothetical protein
LRARVPTLIFTYLLPAQWQIVVFFGLGGAPVVATPPTTSMPTASEASSRSKRLISHPFFMGQSPRLEPALHPVLFVFTAPFTPLSILEDFTTLETFHGPFGAVSFACGGVSVVSRGVSGV